MTERGRRATGFRRVRWLRGLRSVLTWTVNSLAHGRPGTAEPAHEGFASEVKDSLYVPTNEQPVDQPTSWRAVFDVIDHPRPPRDGFEAVFMDPPRVGAQDLSIDEAVGWIPPEDFGPPTDGDAVDTKLVINQCSLVKVDGLGGEDFELDPIGGEFLQIGCVREEVEYRPTICGKNDFFVVDEALHVAQGSVEAGNRQCATGKGGRP